jgi:hypothetical protein
MRLQVELSPIALLDFVARGSTKPGWYVRYAIGGRPASERREIEVGADAFGAITQAAHYLGCNVEQIEFGGPVWPKPLDGMVDADETLEYVIDRSPGMSVSDGQWRLLGLRRSNGGRDNRRFARLDLDDVELYGPLPGRVINWSEAGLGIETARPLRLETRKLFLAEGRRTKIELYGEVRWCRKIDGSSGKRPPTYRAGITLIG